MRHSEYYRCLLFWTFHVHLPALCVTLYFVFPSLCRDHKCSAFFVNVLDFLGFGNTFFFFHVVAWLFLFSLLMAIFFISRSSHSWFYDFFYCVSKTYRRVPTSPLRWLTPEKLVQSNSHFFLRPAHRRNSSPEQLNNEILISHMLF